jgi:hypothetical protein
MTYQAAFARITLVVWLALECITPGARADVKTVNVISVGGQSSNLFVVFSQVVGTDQTCPGARLVLPAGVMDAASQARFYAALLTAYTTGSPVTIAVSTCYGNYPSMLPTDFWFMPQGG